MNEAKNNPGAEEFSSHTGENSGFFQSPMTPRSDSLSAHDDSRLSKGSLVASKSQGAVSSKVAELKKGAAYVLQLGKIVEASNDKESTCRFLKDNGIFINPILASLNRVNMLTPENFEKLLACEKYLSKLDVIFKDLAAKSYLDQAYIDFFMDNTIHIDYLMDQLDQLHVIKQRSPENLRFLGQALKNLPFKSCHNAMVSFKVSAEASFGDFINKFYSEMEPSQASIASNGVAGTSHSTAASGTDSRHLIRNPASLWVSSITITGRESSSDSPFSESVLAARRKFSVDQIKTELDPPRNTLSGNRG